MFLTVEFVKHGTGHIPAVISQLLTHYRFWWICIDILFYSKFTVVKSGFMESGGNMFLEDASKKNETIWKTYNLKPILACYRK